MIDINFNNILDFLLLYCDKGSKITTSLLLLSGSKTHFYQLSYFRPIRILLNTF